MGTLNVCRFLPNLVIIYPFPSFFMLVSLVQELESCFLLKVFFLFFSFNKISVVKTLTVGQLRVELESLHKLELSLCTNDLQRIYYSFSICSPLCKGS